MCRVLCVVCGPFRETVLRNHGTFADLIRKALSSSSCREVSTVEIDMIHLYNDEPLPDAGTYDAIIFSGSKFNITENHDWAVKAALWLKENILLDHVSVPMFAICFGHQLICHALGGVVDWNPHGCEAGTFEVTKVPNSPCCSTDPLLALTGLDQTFAVNAYHNQTVVQRPERSVCFYETAADKNQVLRHAPLVYSTQFHPEFTPELFRDYEPYLGFASDAMRQTFLQSLDHTPKAMAMLCSFTHLALSFASGKKVARPIGGASSSEAPTRPAVEVTSVCSVCS
jgi:GMP synthase (glutamine-hydrolysing)